MTIYFRYGDQETDYLKRKDKRLGELIEAVGPIRRAVDTDLFSSVVHHIVGQQISTKAQATVWKRLNDILGDIRAQTILAASIETLQSAGMTFRKAEYMADFARKVQSGAFDLDGLHNKSDAEAIAALTSLRGIGVWTAEMILLFSMERPDILSFGDLAIQRGLRMVYHHKTISRALFDKYKKRYSPYGSVASLYLWAAAGGAVPGMKDFAPSKRPLN